MDLYLGDKEIGRLTQLQSLFPDVEFSDLLEIASPHLKSEDSFQRLVDRMINTRKQKAKTESDEEEEKLTQGLKSSFQSHMIYDQSETLKFESNKSKKKSVFSENKNNDSIGLIDNYVKENGEELSEIIYGSSAGNDSKTEKKENIDSDSDSFHSFDEENDDPREAVDKGGHDEEAATDFSVAKEETGKPSAQDLNEEKTQKKESTLDGDTIEKLNAVENEFFHFNSLLKFRKNEKKELIENEEPKKSEGFKKINRKKEETKETENDVGLMIDHFFKQDNYTKKQFPSEDEAKDYARTGAIPKRTGLKHESKSRSGSILDDDIYRFPDRRATEREKEEKVSASPGKRAVSEKGEKEEISVGHVPIADSSEKDKVLPSRTTRKLKLPDFPFYYVVPENPTSEFCLPKGAYFVSHVKDLDEDSMKTLKQIYPFLFHPEPETQTGTTISKGSAKPALGSKLEELPAEKKINSGLSSLTFPSPPSASHSRGNETIKINRSEVKTKIFCNTPLQSLKMDGEGTNDSTDAYGLILQSVAKDFGSGDKVSKRKKNSEPKKISFELPSKSNLNLPKAEPEEVGNNFEDVLSKTKNFEPGLKAESKQEKLLELLNMLKNVEPEELVKTLKDHDGGKKIRNDFVQEENPKITRASIEQTLFEEAYSKALKELPDADPEVLYIKIQSLNGNERAIESFIQEEKVKTQLKDIKNKLSSNFPNFDRDFLDKKSKDFLCDPDGLATFIQEEKRKLKIDEQYELMVNSLPGVDPLFLRRLAEDVEGNPELVREFIEEKKLELKKEEEKTNQIINMHLILPDADPEFLQNKLEELSATGDPAAFNAFLFNLLESKDYPKIQKDDPAVRERNELWRRFVENFDVKDFLNKVPNPEETFSGPKGDNNKTDLGLILKFLQSRYPDLDVTVLEKIFRDRKNNLTNTCLQLDFQQRPIEIMDVSFRSENISEFFLLELVFILHRQEIRDYLQEEKTLRELKLELARKDKTLLECRCCFDEELLETDVTTCPEGHIFCIDCVKRSVETKLADGVTKFQCLAENCEFEFSLVTLERVLEQSLYQKVFKKRQSAEVNEAKVPGLESCPSCDFAYIPSPLDKIFKCQNPDCLRETCRNCQEESHVPLRCEEVERPKDTKIRTEIEEKMTEALVRTCPKCGKKFVKTDGCNKMTCTCGAVMCYLCRKLVDSYAHFNGQGGGNFHLCPLWSTNEDLHINRVKEVGVRARDEALRQNPDLHLVHDPTKTI